jgi:tRNA(Arg) A34 adenosine deaminase TadA
MAVTPEADFLQRAIELAADSVRGGGGPFGAVVVRDGAVVGEGRNLVTTSNDPTAHAEIVALREACARLATFELSGCILYASCEPCPMCLGAAYWARVEAVVFAATRSDAAAVGFDDERIYRELSLPIESRTLPFRHVAHHSAAEPFEAWNSKADRVEY